MVFVFGVKLLPDMFDLISSLPLRLVKHKHTYFGLVALGDEVTQHIHREKEKKEIIAFVSITKKGSERICGVLVCALLCAREPTVLHSPNGTALLFREPVIITTECAIGPVGVLHF
jgi:hypothetical protein